jgi:diguanylate cyclase (GGDEF)-like protein
VIRRRFDEDLERELRRTRRDGKPISLIMLDIDRFKAFNDRYGHPAGDDCIRRVAQLLAEKARRPADIVARYGGEEMCVVLPDTDEAGAYGVAEAIRVCVRALGLLHEGSEKGVITVSLGIASYSGEIAERSPAELISRADQALYVLKSVETRSWDGNRGAWHAQDRRRVASYDWLPQLQHPTNSYRRRL